MSSTLKPWLILAVIFIAGGVTGSALTLGLASHFTHSRGSKQLNHEWLVYLTHELKLTPDQQTKVEPILTDADTLIQAARREQAANVAVIIKKTNDQIAVLLTPAQQTELQRVEKDMDRSRDKMFPGWKRAWSPGGIGMPPRNRPDDPPPPADGQRPRDYPDAAPPPPPPPN